MADGGGGGRRRGTAMGRFALYCEATRRCTCCVCVVVDTWSLSWANGSVMRWRLGHRGPCGRVDSGAGGRQSGAAAVARRGSIVCEQLAAAAVNSDAQSGLAMARGSGGYRRQRACASVQCLLFVRATKPLFGPFFGVQVPLAARRQGACRRDPRGAGGRKTAAWCGVLRYGGVHRVSRPLGRGGWGWCCHCRWCEHRAPPSAPLRAVPCGWRRWRRTVSGYSGHELASLSLPPSSAPAGGRTREGRPVGSVGGTTQASNNRPCGGL